MTAHRIIVCGTAAAAPGHRAYSGPVRHHSVDGTDEARRRLARYHLYAGCDRAPIGWEQRA